MIYLFNVLFCNRVLSYFAKPNFIVYDEWFDNDFQKTKLNVKNKKITNISKIHEFFYEQSNYKVGASENNLQIDINENREKLFNNFYFKNNSKKYDSLSNNKFLFFGKITKNTLNFDIKKNNLYFINFWICNYFGITAIFYFAI